MSRLQRIELFLFITCLFAFAYFNQGGGWNQNARFAEVRAMAEEGRFAIDNFLVFQRNPDREEMTRVPVENAEYTLHGTRFRLCWVDMTWNLYPIGEHPLAEGVEKAPMVELCASGDVGFVDATGHFHPNKPPGTSFLALPGYWLIFHVEKLLGINPDHWWTMNLNAWLTSVCSVGLISALGCVLFFRLAREFAGGATLPAVLAGGCAGMAAVTNYIAAVAVIFLGLYVLLATRRGARHWRGALHFSLGVLGPFLLLCGYHWVNFGSPFRINNDFQNPLFKETSGVILGMFGVPSSYVAGLLIASPFRGVFFFSPVLALGIYGLFVWLREKTFVAEARLCAAIFGFFFFTNVCFNGYHAGFSAGPRYLVPGLPFLALPLAVAFARWRWIASALAVVSVAIHTLLTATDAQSPVGVGGHARVEEKRDEWDYNLVTDYAWPLFAQGRAWKMLDEQMALHMEKETQRIAAETNDPAEQKQRADELRAALRESIGRGEPSPFLLASIKGPVSVNPIGSYEGLLTYHFFPPGSHPCVWASFNVGEFFWPQSPWSLLPLLLVTGGFGAAATMLARHEPL